MSTGDDRNGAAGVKGAPQGKRAQVTAAEAKELLKPIVFGNYERHFKIFTAVVSAAMAYYLVFHHDFGPKQHIYTPLREWRKRMMKEIFYIDPNDSEVQRMKEKRKQDSIAVATDERTLHSNSDRQTSEPSSQQR